MSERSTYIKPVFERLSQEEIDRGDEPRKFGDVYIDRDGVKFVTSDGQTLYQAPWEVWAMQQILVMAHGDDISSSLETVRQFSVHVIDTGDSIYWEVHRESDGVVMARFYHSEMGPDTAYRFAEDLEAGRVPNRPTVPS